MRTRQIAIQVAIFLPLACSTAHAQQLNVACANAKLVNPDTLAFILAPGSDTPISSDEYHPTSIDSEKSSTLRVCVPIDVRSGPRQGAFNIRAQISTGAGDATGNKRAVEYENDTDQFQKRLATFRKTRKSDAYPTLDIQDYQDYHGCVPARPGTLDSEFHVTVDNRRTSDGVYRSKFLFHHDLLPNCNSARIVLDYFEAFPNFGIPIAVAGGWYDPSVDKIVFRRSAILRFRLKDKYTEDRLYLAYTLPRLKKGQCIRVEASNVLDDARPIAELIGVACFIQPE